MTRHMLGVDKTAQHAEPVGISRPHGAITATLVGFNGNGVPLVEIPGEPCLTARSCVPLDGTHVGRLVVLLPDERHPESPIVIGVIHSPAKKVELIADGQKVTVRADESITLSCGEASITLSRDGKVVIRGKHIVTHASCVNRIRGGSVELN